MNKAFFKNEKGHLLLQALVVMPLLCAALYLPFSFAIIQHQRSVLNNVLDLSLQRAAVSGGINNQLVGEILTEMQNRGFNPADVVINSNAFIEKTRGEVIEISISVSGNDEILKGVRAIGGTPPPEGWSITAVGSIMSEKIP